MTSERTERRQRRRAYTRAGEAVLKSGLPLLPRKEALVGLTLLLEDALTGKGRADRASAAAQMMHKVLEASVRARPGTLALACRKGCNYCCHGWVSATAPELFLIAGTLARGSPASSGMTPEAVLARAEATAGLGIAERIGRKLPCPLLSNGACGVYAVRPVVCRQVTATAVAGCIDEFDGRTGGSGIEVSRVYLDHARNCRIPLQAALSACGLSQRSYELSAGLKTALAPGAEAAWLDGADLFEGVAMAPADPAPLAEAVRTIARGAAAA